MASSETVPSAGHKPRGIMSFLRSQMRNIAPFLTLIFLSGFFAVASPSFATIDNVGNILTQVSSGVAAESGDFTKTAELYKKGLDEMAAAVALAPDNVGVVIPRGATLLTASHTVPGDNGKELLRMGLADYEHVYQIQAPRFDKLPGHARGELLFGLAEGYARLGDAGQARQWFEKLAAVDDPENGHLGQARDYLKTGSLGGSVKCVGCHVGK